MRSVGQICLLVALIGSGYAAYLLIAGSLRHPLLLRRTAAACLAAATCAITAVVAILAWALVTKDFSFAYVAHYSSRLLPWSYSLSALWVGQAGSLLLWAWLLAALTVAFRLIPARNAALRDAACGVLLAYLAFLIAVMVFAADPMEASLHPRSEGNGLSPLLQHPSMLIHPPVVFFAYAAWTVPFALAIAALVRGELDSTWTQMARPWALLGWCLLGAGLLLGAHWAYQELGWGGYWGWDPVENGSLVPWLTGTALIHCLMAWRYRNGLKKTALALAIVTFGLCNFATFLTRSGVFSSVHAFSQSPIGWMFLGLMLLLLVAGAVLMFLRRDALRVQRTPSSFLARESLIVVSTFLLLLLTAVVTAGTLVVPVSTQFLGRTIQVGAPYYNNVLAPIGLALLALTAAVPLLRWGEGPGPAQRRALWISFAISAAAVAIGLALGVRQPLLLVVLGLSVLTAASLLGALLLDARRRKPATIVRGMFRALRDNRRQYAGYVVHLGFMALAIGVTGSSLGTQQREAVLSEGESLRWAGREIRYVELLQHELPDKLVAEAVLHVARDGETSVTLRPARHLHLLQNEWTTEVAIHSTWRGDFYTILNAGLGDGQVSLTLVDNPLLCWIWLGGLISLAGALTAMWPVRKRQAKSIDGVDASQAKEPPEHAEHARKAA
jgi:cytochrome c-type biogenesis protein CcmF